MPAILRSLTCATCGVAILGCADARVRAPTFAPDPVHDLDFVVPLGNMREAAAPSPLGPRVAPSFSTSAEHSSFDGTVVSPRVSNPTVKSHFLNGEAIADAYAYFYARWGFEVGASLDLRFNGLQIANPSSRTRVTGGVEHLPSAFLQSAFATAGYRKNCGHDAHATGWFRAEDRESDGTIASHFISLNDSASQPACTNDHEQTGGDDGDGEPGAPGGGDTGGGGGGDEEPCQVYTCWWQYEYDPVTLEVYDAWVVDCWCSG